MNKSPRCGHNPLSIDCGLCRLALTSPKWRNHWGISLDPDEILPGPLPPLQIPTPTSVEGAPQSGKDCVNYSLKILEKRDPSGKPCLCPTKYVYECDLFGSCAHHTDGRRPGLYVCSPSCPGYDEGETPIREPTKEGGKRADVESVKIPRYLDMFPVGTKTIQILKKRPMKWAYGVTTVPERFPSTLPKTLKSLQGAGFDEPVIFVDGCSYEQAEELQEKYPGCRVAARKDRITTNGNWWLSLWELYIREPNADRYAIFQDDFVTYLNLREYLERSGYPEAGYLNCYTFPINQELAPKGYTGWYLSNQRGLGAVATIYSKGVVQKLLASEHIVGKFNSSNTKFRTKSIDGGIVTALKKIGVKEFVHTPSLTQHIGVVSSMGNSRQAMAETYRGDRFDALDLFRERT